MNFRRILKVLLKDRKAEVNNRLHPFVMNGEYERLSSYPRRQHGTSELFSKKVEFGDAYWYQHSIQEIFVDQVYKFNSDKRDPYIIDCGSNIGLSLIYFKTIFPNCRIKAFEADPDISEMSRRNLMSSGVSGNVTIIEKAVWTKEGYIEFLAEGTLGGTLLFTEDMEQQKVIKIPCEDLSRHLNEPVDFLKLDIEGAELEVLEACQDKLSNVENLFVEFHGFCAKEQNLEKLLVLLKNAGFRYYIKESYPNLVYPFVEKVPNNYFDILLNIFCYRL